MSRLQWLPWLAIVLSMALFGVSSLLPLQGMWSYNNLAWLNSSFVYAAVIAVGIMAAALLIPGGRLDAWLDSLDRVLSARPMIWGLMFAVSFSVIFWLFRSATHFLGDGYTMISVFGQSDTAVPGWAEPGSVMVVRAIQSLFGEYTRESARLAAQAASILSGAVTIVNFVVISARLSDRSGTRLLILFSLMTSGTMLLFFGYVEHYPLLWAAGTTFISLSLGYLHHGRRLWLVLLVFAATLFMHLQAVYFLAGVLFLVLRRRLKLTQKSSLRSGPMLLLGAVTLAGLLVFIWLLRDDMRLGSVFLSVWSGPSNAPGYAILSLWHLLDLVNEALVLLPGLAVLIALALAPKEPDNHQERTLFLGLLSVGSVLFLVTVDPDLGMARDWDLMSMTLLPPSLLLFGVIDRLKRRIGSKVIVVYALMCAAMTTTYVAANTTVPASEDRFRALLRYYDTKDDTGWPILTYYYLNNEDYPRALSLAKYMEQNQIRLEKTYHILAVLSSKQGRLDEAERYYKLAIERKPYHPHIKNELGQLYLRQQRNDLALETLKQARQNDPRLTFIAEGVGLAYYRLGHLDSATAIADTLFAGDPHSPGGHLIKMIVAIALGDNTAARTHLEQYLQYGRGRSDYENIREYYGYLLD